MRLIAIALDGNVLGLIKPLVGTATVHALAIRLRRALVASDGVHWKDKKDQLANIITTSVNTVN